MDRELIDNTIKGLICAVVFAVGMLCGIGYLCYTASNPVADKPARFLYAQPVLVKGTSSSIYAGCLGDALRPNRSEREYLVKLTWCPFREDGDDEKHWIKFSDLEVQR